jgi:predicted transcriptional regulator
LAAFFFAAAVADADNSACADTAAEADAADEDDDEEDDDDDVVVDSIDEIAELLADDLRKLTAPQTNQYNQRPRRVRIANRNLKVHFKK